MDVSISEGKTWVEQRRFALRTLRDFGFGKKGMEEMIQEEVEMFKSLINKTTGEPFDFINQLNLPILNALWRITVRAGNEPSRSLKFYNHGKSPNFYIEDNGWLTPA